MKNEWTEQDLRQFVESSRPVFQDVSLTQVDEDADRCWQDDGLMVDYELRGGQVDCVLRRCVVALSLIHIFFLLCCELCQRGGVPQAVLPGPLSPALHAVGGLEGLSLIHIYIRECDAIVHVVRCFDDDNIIHVVEDVTKAEAVDPIADIDAIDYELILSDLEVVQNRAGRMAKAAKSGNNKGAAAEAAWLQQLAAHLESGKPARSFDFDENDAEQQTVLHEMGLLSAKPVLYACNVGEDDLMEGIENNKYVPLVAARAKEEGARYIPICAKTEEDIADYSPEEKKAFLAEMGLSLIHI